MGLRFREYEFEYEVLNCVSYLEMNWICEILDG